MSKPNWDIFKAKFSENHQNNFEWFCYLLFCSEFNKPFGVFRYKNQSAIETNPVVEGENIIGWQAKFYDTTLSNNKNDLINTIKKAKRDYTNITKLIFYTNQEWAQYRGKEPKGKTEAERTAEELNIKLEWRTASFFESSFVTIENKGISKCFFNFDNGILELIDEKRRHTENILNEIQTSMDFKGEVIEIERKQIILNLKEDKRTFILSGAGGVGKTAVIKNFYSSLNENIPFYIFKATEFELRNIEDFFKGQNFFDFLDIHKRNKEKIIVIDSAEKLLDLKNSEPFKEFLSSIIKCDWKIIFTTRDNYLEDLNYQFFDIYKIIPVNINIPCIVIDELNELSAKYKFSLPKDVNLLELIKTPFYLSEYLRFYNESEELDYIGFKNKLWDKVIKKSKPVREQCFLKIASERANEGHFFIMPDCEAQVLDGELKNDGVLGYETAGYFITHDIYEEWALEKIIQTEFFKKSNNSDFFKRIGQSLPFRRSFRKWVSEKLALDEDIKHFINETITDKSIESFWKDEILISVLLSDYSSAFFNSVKSELLDDEQSLLKKMTFILRLACKEVDEEVFKQIGIKNINLFTLEYILTKPKGKGWESLIKFIYENIDAIGVENISFILPAIHDWNSKFKVGETTRFSSLIALKYYQWIIEEDVYISHDESETKLLQTIVYGALEVNDELKEIFDNILSNRWKEHRDPYYGLSKFILTEQESFLISKAFPDYVLQIADLFWSGAPKEEDCYGISSLEMEHYFGLQYGGHDYFPASSYQTPIFWLLQCSLKNTIDFILKFTNKAVEYYAKSELDRGQVEENEIFFDEDKSIKQYNSNRLWCIYRGTQVCPDVLESIHMALEKYFLDAGKNAKSKNLEYWLLYLLENAKSASISGVVASVVVAYPEKTFNVAKILFKTKKFFSSDTTRLVLDQTHKSSLLMLRNNYGFNNEKVVHEDERLNACDDKHRKWDLENIFLNYQFFRSKETSVEDAEKRQKILWGILDDYYKKLTMDTEESESDKTWRLYLARMDKRKMKPSTEEIDDGILVSLNPEIDPKLKKYSDDSLQKISEPMKYSALKIWAKYKMEGNEEYLQYEKYDSNPKVALKEVKEIIEKLKSLKNENDSNMLDDENFHLFNHTIPGQVCSVLIKYFFDELSEKDQVFCKDVILEIAFFTFSDDYQYQVSDGMQSVISVLPILSDEFQEEKKHIKLILLMCLFNDYPIDMSGTGFNIFSVMAINTLWENDFDNAQSLLYGYLLLRPRYKEIENKLREENYKNGAYKISKSDVINVFLDDYELAINNLVNNELPFDEIKNIDELDLSILRTAFNLIPVNTKSDEHKKIVISIISSFSKQLLSTSRQDKVDYTIRHDFLRKLSYFILNTSKEDIYTYLRPFIENLNNSESVADFFQEFVLTEDKLDSYDNFWTVWLLFKDNIIELCAEGDKRWHIDKIVKSYLFAQVTWKDTTNSWHSLKENNKQFFKDISHDIGHCPSTLYAISKLLNDIGIPYLNDGVSWVSLILKKNNNLLNSKLEVNTIYYLESLVRRFIYDNREKIRKTKALKEEVLVILDFLIAKGSVVGYMLRENTL